MMLSIITTFYNDASVLPLFVQEIRPVLEKISLDWEIIFVDDASTDGSWNFIKSQSLSEPRYKAVRMSKQCGIPACFWAGLSMAKGDAIVLIDTDLQDPPSLIPSMISAWKQGADIVHAVRMAREGEPWIKLKLTHLAYQIFYTASNKKLPVEAGDFKLVSKKACHLVLENPESSPYLRGRFAALNLPQASIAYIRKPRAAGTSHFSLFSKSPLKTAASGFLFSLFGIRGIVFRRSQPAYTIAETLHD